MQDEDFAKLAEEMMKKQQAMAAEMMAKQKALIEAAMKNAGVPQAGMPDVNAMMAQALALRGAAIQGLGADAMQAQMAAALAAGGLDAGDDDDEDDEPEPDLPMQDRFALALSAIVFEINGHSHAWLHGDSPKHEWHGSICRNTLEEWWDIESIKDLRKTLAWLTEEGHSAEAEAYRQALIGNGGDADRAFEALSAEAGDEVDADDCAEIRRKLKLLKKELFNVKSLLAWDLGRAVAVVRWGAGGELLTDKEAWRIIRKLAVRTQKEFGSWKAFGENYLLGMRFWRADKDMQAECAEAVQTLLDPKNADSPWNAVPWDTEINLK